MTVVILEKLGIGHQTGDFLSRISWDRTLGKLLSELEKTSDVEVNVPRYPADYYLVVHEVLPHIGNFPHKEAPDISGMLTDIRLPLSKGSHLSYLIKDYPDGMRELFFSDRNKQSGEDLYHLPGFRLVGDGPNGFRVRASTYDVIQVANALEGTARDRGYLRVDNPQSPCHFRCYGMYTEEGTQLAIKLGHGRGQRFLTR